VFINEYWRIINEGNFLELPKRRRSGGSRNGMGSRDGHFWRSFDDARPRSSYSTRLGFLVSIRYFLSSSSVNRPQQNRVDSGLDLDCWYALRDFGVALIHSGRAIGDPFAAAGSMTVLADMLLFGWLVIRREQYSVSAL
jgi:hypothetical protein